MKTILTVLLLAMSIGIHAQELSVEDTESISITELPEYVIITSENTGLIGGINISIDSKKSKYQDQLTALTHMLQSGKKLRVRNQTDLLNSMSELGFEYINAYIGRDSGYEGKSYQTSKYRVNMVFRKKQQYRK